ncbi:porin family protein [Pedobacter gandavensis]|uniref:porin family protein n=1 Tax=Pedobacter gandavensis TaxID=2679963 RepID=UPI00292E7C57|nr:porin family protein [Pedobacter gandavensis]
MKKLLLSCMLLTAAISASAQNNPIKIGLKAGFNVPTFTTGEGLNGVKPNPSFYIGGTLDFPVNEGFSLQSGLTFSGKGGKPERIWIGGSRVDVDARTRLWYLEVPVNAVFYFPAGRAKLFLGGGPYYGYALSGRDKTTLTFTSEEGIQTKKSTSNDIGFGKDGSMKRSDFGLNFLAGYQLTSGLNIHAGYGLGLTGIARDSDFIRKNRVWSVGVGFSF